MTSRHCTDSSSRASRCISAAWAPRARTSTTTWPLPTGSAKEADTIQELYLSGKKAEATEAVPDELVKNISLIGPKSFVAERVAAFKEAGVTTLNVAPLAADAAGRIKHVEALRELL